LKQRLAPFDLDTFLDKHPRNERWLRQARNELDRALNYRCIDGVGRYESKTYQEHKHQVDNKKSEDDSPSGREPDELESKEYKPKRKASDCKNEKSSHHDGVSPGGVSGGVIVGGALPANLAIISSVAIRSCFGR
jgi:hypothetical protein